MVWWEIHVIAALVCAVKVETRFRTSHENSESVLDHVFNVFDVVAVHLIAPVVRRSVLS